MLVLENKIKELESQGLSHQQIQSQTQDLFDQLINEDLEEESTYLVDVNVTLAIKTKIKPEKLHALLQELEVSDIVLNVYDEDKLKVESLCAVADVDNISTIE